MASDSRTSNQDGTFRDNTKKIHVVGLAGFDQFLVATAGHDDLADRAIEILARRAKGISLTDYRTVAELTQAAITELKGDIRQQFLGSSEELQKHFRDYSFELMIAHYYKGVPFIFTVDFEIGIVRTQQTSCLAIGCGRLLAEFCLDGLQIPEMHQMEAYTTAVYAVEEVKKFDARCGGPVQLGLCWAQASVEGPAHSTHALVQHPGYVQLIVTEIALLSKEANTRWKSQLSQVLGGVENTIKESIMKFQTDNPDL